MDVKMFRVSIGNNSSRSKVFLTAIGKHRDGAITGENTLSAAPRLHPPWKPGQSGNPVGRPKKIFPRVDQLLKEFGKEPIKELLALLPTLKERDQAQIWLEILPYVHAKAKPVEDSDEDELEKMSTAELVRLVKEQLPEIEEK